MCSKCDVVADQEVSSARAVQLLQRNSLISRAFPVLQLTFHDENENRPSVGVDDPSW